MTAPPGDSARGRPPITLERLLDQLEEIVAGVALIVVVTSVTWGVVTRYITAQPAAWASEIATLAFAWVVFFGAAACIKYRLHPTIDMLVVRLPGVLQDLVRRFNQALLFAFFAFMVWFGTRFSIDAATTGTAVLEVPLVWLYGPVTLCFALMLVRQVQVVRGRHWSIVEQRDTHVG